MTTWERTDKASCTHSFYILVGGWIINKNRTSAVRKIRQRRGVALLEVRIVRENVRLEQRGLVQRTQGRKLCRYLGEEPSRQGGQQVHHHH